MTWIIAIAGLILPLLFGGKSEDRWWEGYVYGVWSFGIPLFVYLMFDKFKEHILELGIVLIGGYLVYAKTSINHLPLPHDTDERKPKPTRRPLLPLRESEVGSFSEGDSGPNGEEVLTDLVDEYRKKNISSLGAGCCVFRSLEHLAKYQNTPALYDFAEWMVKNRIRGGGYPEKVDQLVAKICKDRNTPTVPYVQHTGGDPKFLELALKTGRMVGVTYSGHDTRYGMNETIAHMVNLVYLDDNYACILDNNYPHKYYWMSRGDFLQRWNGYNRDEKGWAVVLLTPPPIPVIHN